MSDFASDILNWEGGLTLAWHCWIQTPRVLFKATHSNIAGLKCKAVLHLSSYYLHIKRTLVDLALLTKQEQKKEFSWKMKNLSYFVMRWTLMCGAPWGKLAKKASSADSCDSNRSRATAVSLFGDCETSLDTGLVLRGAFTKSVDLSSTPGSFFEDIDSLIERL